LIEVKRHRQLGGKAVLELILLDDNLKGVVFSRGAPASRRKGVFPAGMAAANLLGFTTQTAKRPEVATTASSLPPKLVGSDTVVTLDGRRLQSVPPELNLLSSLDALPL